MARTRLGDRVKSLMAAYDRIDDAPIVGTSVVDEANVSVASIHRAVRIDAAMISDAYVLVDMHDALDELKPFAMESIRRLQLNAYRNDRFDALRAINEKLADSGICPLIRDRGLYDSAQNVHAFGRSTAIVVRRLTTRYECESADAIERHAENLRLPLDRVRSILADNGDATYGDVSVAAIVGATLRRMDGRVRDDDARRDYARRFGEVTSAEFDDVCVVGRVVRVLDSMRGFDCDDDVLDVCVDEYDDVRSRLFSTMNELVDPVDLDGLQRRIESFVNETNFVGSFDPLVVERVVREYTGDGRWRYDERRRKFVVDDA